MIFFYYLFWPLTQFFYLLSKLAKKVHAAVVAAPIEEKVVEAAPVVEEEPAAEEVVEDRIYKRRVLACGRSLHSSLGAADEFHLCTLKFTLGNAIALDSLNLCVECLKCSLVFGQVYVWTVSFAQQRCTRISKVAYLVLVAQHLL